jgi:trimeric autotransporter adhesin
MIRTARVYIFILFLVCCGGFSGSCYAQLHFSIIKTYAGTGMTGYSGDGGPATNARCWTPSGITIDDTGQVYFCDQLANCVRKISSSGIVTTVAGSGTSGYSGDGGPATDARIYWPQGITMDHFGNLYISDQFSNTIRKVTAATGIITTIAGNNSLIGYSGDGGPATAAGLWHPTDVAVDAAGIVYFADQDNSAVRKVNPATGIVTTLAGTGLAGYNGDGIMADTAQLNFPNGITTDSAGNVYIADLYNNRVRKVDVITGIITTVAGNGTAGYGSDGGLADTSMLYNPSALKIDRYGNLYIADYNNARIRKVDAATGIIHTVAGNGSSGYSGDHGPATAGQIYWPQGVTVDTIGNIYIADYQNSRVRIVTDSIVDTSTTLVTDAAVKNERSCRIFPNPCKGLFILDISVSNLPGTAEVRNLMGECIFKAPVTRGQTTIDLGKPPAGIYTIYITSGSANWVRKLVISD